MQPQIGYCTNVHAGTDLAQTRANLANHALKVKQLFCPTQPMGIGLWLAAPAAEQLLAENKCDEFRDWLGACGLVPFTFNGFPYGDFHSEVVKHDVYLPTWLEESRVQYTLDLVEIQHRLLADGLEGSISTLPIGWGDPRLDAGRLAAAANNLRRIADRLFELEQESGRLIYLCLEPEPGCELQLSADVVRFFNEYLLPGGNEERVRRYLRVCHDVCHAAVMFEDQQQVLESYRAAGIQVGKVQVSSAVVVRFDRMAAEARLQALQQLAAFAEDRYLHQTVVRDSRGNQAFSEDLPLALAAVVDPAQLHEQWRVHFHVPIYLERFGLLETSRPQVLECIEAASALPGLLHYEVETYAWSVLPEELRKEQLSQGIADELEWFQAQFSAPESHD